MGTTLNKHTYEKLIKADLEILDQLSDSLEKRHIISVLKDSIDFYYQPREGETPQQSESNFAIPVVIASVCDTLLTKASEYEDKANNDYDTEEVQHNLNVGRYDGLMQAIAELNKHLL